MLSRNRRKDQENWQIYGASVKFTQVQKRKAQLSSVITPLQLWSKEQVVRRLTK